MTHHPLRNMGNTYGIKSGWYSLGDNTFVMWAPGGMIVQTRLYQATAMVRIKCSLFSMRDFLLSYGIDPARD